MGSKRFIPARKRAFLMQGIPNHRERAPIGQGLVNLRQQGDDLGSIARGGRHPLRSGLHSGRQTCLLAHGRIIPYRL